MNTPNRSMWGSVAAACATTAVAIAVNFATDLKTNVLAWIAVPVLTLLAGVVTESTQRAARGERLSPLLASPSGRRLAIGATALTAATIVIGVIALSATSGTERGATHAPITGSGTTIGADTETVASTPTKSPTVLTAPQQAQVAVQQATSYPLVSSSAFCPKTDKVDLDTAQPGHGGQPQLGEYVDRCKVDGGLAELILEQDKIHTPNGGRLLLLMKHSKSADYNRCRVAVLNETEHLANSISLRELRVTDHICVRTDQGNLAQVNIDEINLSWGREARVVISFTVWRS